MDQKTFNTVAGIVFGVAAIVHLVRAVYGWDLALGEWMLPVWASYAGVLVAGFLSYRAFKLNK
ncbi:hypothetical protein KW797_04025 [Candidatus Parcubacteria bacterium]|nr:hypothetical protein [Candidatus Parcubacteria bacterium]